MEQKTKIILLLILVVAGIIALGVMAIYMINQAEECVGNPLVYGANKMYETDDVESFCTCYFSDPNYAPFMFNRTDVVVVTD